MRHFDEFGIPRHPQQCLYKRNVDGQLLEHIQEIIELLLLVHHFETLREMWGYF